MSAKLEQRVRDRSGADYVTLSGVIDEDSDLAALAEKLDVSPASVVVLLLANVERINDVGSRDFSRFLDTLAEQSAKLVLVGCSPAVVGQLNLNRGVGEGLIVKSFSAPYFCPECDEPRTLVCEAVDFDLSSGGATRSPPVRRCEVCEYVMQFDDEAESYFAFLADRTTPIDPTLEDQITEHLLASIDESAPTELADPENIPRAPRRATTATGPIAGPIAGWIAGWIDRLRGLPAILMIAIIIAVVAAVVIAMW